MCTGGNAGCFLFDNAVGVDMDSGSGGCDESYSTDTGVEVSACDMEISPGMTKYWRPICANSLKPHVGQQFDSLDSAFGFYKQYAGSVGFDCRQSTTRKGRDGGFGFSSTHFRTASSVALIGALMSIIGRGCRGRSGEYSSTGRFPLSFAWISGGGSDELPDKSFSGLHAQFHQLNLGHLGYPSMRPPLERMSEGAVSTRVDILSSAVAMVLVVLVISSTKSFWGSVPAALVGVGHQHGESMDLLLQQLECPRSEGWVASWHIEVWDVVDIMKMANVVLVDITIYHRVYNTVITSRAKCLLNQGSPASVSNILVIIAAGVIHAVVFSKIALHSRRISETALVVRFVISICPIGSPRVAATSAAVIWIDCPFWSCKVQLLGSKFSTNHNLNLREFVLGSFALDVSPCSVAFLLLPT
nr:protein FAR1-RELATED SEQUENCE 5-like [Ipomoea batatas]